LGLVGRNRVEMAAAAPDGGVRAPAAATLNRPPTHTRDGRRGRWPSQALVQAAMNALRVWVCFFSAFHCLAQSAVLADLADAAAGVGLGAGLSAATAAPATEAIRIEARRILRMGGNSPWSPPVRRRR